MVFTLKAGISPHESAQREQLGDGEFELLIEVRTRQAYARAGNVSIGYQLLEFSQQLLQSLLLLLQKAAGGRDGAGADYAQRACVICLFCGIFTGRPDLGYRQR